MISNQIKGFTETIDSDVFLIDLTLSDKKYKFNELEILFLLIPGYIPIVINCNHSVEEFLDFFEDFIEDIGFLSDTFEYKDIIGRPRKWRDTLILRIDNGKEFNVQHLEKAKADNTEKRRGADLLISLLTGSINSALRVGIDAPTTVIDKIKRKIILFDCDQTRFIYETFQIGAGRSTRIQGLSGTGKTTLSADPNRSKLLE